MQPSIHHNTNLLKVNQTSSAAVAANGGNIQVILPQGCFSARSVIEVRLTTTATNADNILARADMSPFLSQLICLKDGLQVGLYQNHGAATLAAYQNEQVEADLTAQYADGFGSTKKWRVVATATGTAQVVSLFFSIKHFLPGVFALEGPASEYFKIHNQMVLTIQVGSLTDCLAKQAKSTGSGTVLTAISATDALVIAHMRIIVDEMPDLPITPMYLQQQYKNQQGVNSVQMIGQGVICSHQQLCLVTPNGTVKNIDDYTGSTAVITKNGFQLVQSENGAQTRAQFATSADSHSSAYYGALVGTWEQLFSNASITHIINLGVEADVYIGFYMIAQNQ